MARVNVEDSIYRDDRFFDLAAKLGSREAAIGALVLAWDLAQRWWKSTERMIPADEWAKLKFGKVVIECGLAQAIDGKVYVKGSRDRLGWIEACQNAGKTGGKKSGNERNKKTPTCKNKGESAKGSQGFVRVPQGFEASPSPSPSPSAYAHSSYEECGEGSQGSLLPVVISDSEVLGSSDLVDDVILPKPLRKWSKTNQFILAYIAAWKTKFPGRPQDLTDPVVLGQIKAWLKYCPIERACQLIQVYFQVEDRWFGTKVYDFMTFKQNLNKIGLALDSGLQPGAAKEYDWSKVFGAA